MLRHYILGACRQGPAEAKLETPASKLAGSLTLLFYVCLLYWLLVRGAGPLVTTLTPSRWPFTILEICSLGVAVVAIIGIFRGASPIFGHMGVVVAVHVTAAPQAVAQLQCPKCGVLSDAGSKFCSFCGAEIPASAAPEAPPRQRRTCASCAAILAPAAKFCWVCGKSSQDAP